MFTTTADLGGASNPTAVVARKKRRLELKQACFTARIKSVLRLEQRKLALREALLAGDRAQQSEQARHEEAWRAEQQRPQKRQAEQAMQEEARLRARVDVEHSRANAEKARADVAQARLLVSF